jgi:hypothetical protein
MGSPQPLRATPTLHQCATPTHGHRTTCPRARHQPLRHHRATATLHQCATPTHGHRTTCSWARHQPLRHHRATPTLHQRPTPADSDCAPPHQRTATQGLLPAPGASSGHDAPSLPQSGAKPTTPRNERRSRAASADEERIAPKKLTLLAQQTALTAQPTANTWSWSCPSARLVARGSVRLGHVGSFRSETLSRKSTP